MAFIGGVLLLISAFRHFAWLTYWWEHHNPPYAIGRVFQLLASLLGALFCFTQVPSRDHHPSLLRRMHVRSANAIDNAPIPLPFLLGGALFIGGALGLVTHNAWDLDFLAFAISASLGFYILKRAISVKDV